MQFKLQAADVGDHVEIVTGAIDLGVDPRPGFFADKSDGVGNRRFGDACINGSLDQLRCGALGVRYFALLPGIDHQFGVDLHLVQQHGAAGGGTLAETGPVVDDAQARGATADEGHDLAAVVVQRLDRHPVGKQGAGGIELLATEHIMIALAGDPRLEVQGVLGAAFRPGIADAPAVEH
ncbi:hypothetical protein D3C79_833060 [compost metagenome]